MRSGWIIKFLIVLLLISGVASAQQKSRSAHDQELYALARTDLKAFAEQVSKNATSELGRAQAIVRWLAENFEWKATDYQKRTVQQIIDREGGNCNELAMVALAAIKELNIPLRRVHEINIHTNTPERGETARAKVKEKGNTLSVFGRRHNDHIWLELYDSTAKEWFPADPSSGLVGLDEWEKARVGFGKRFTLNPITEDMIVPFAVFAADADGKFTINRTQHYVIDEFDRLYAGALHRQPAWKKWTDTIDLLDDKVGGAFAGKINLHEYEAQIDSLAATYEELRAAFQNKPPTPIFVFHTDEFWLNLHHFLYVLGRVQNKAPDITREAVIGAAADQDSGLAVLTAEERKTWAEAVSAYASDLSKKDIVFEEPLPRITKALATAGDAKSLDGVAMDASVAAILERAAPTYRKAWWPKHHSANQAWKSLIQQLIDRDGGAVLAFITNAYKMTWPEDGYNVHLTGFSNWAGAYSTFGYMLVMSSLYERLHGPYGLEIVFHEGMHQSDSEVQAALREHAQRTGKQVPGELPHALIWFTAGDAVRRVMPGYVPYADKFGVWNRGLMQFKAPLEEVWKPYLDGRGTRDEAFAELIKRVGTVPKSKP